MRYEHRVILCVLFFMHIKLIGSTPQATKAFTFAKSSAKVNKAPFFLGKLRSSRATYVKASSENGNS